MSKTAKIAIEFASWLGIALLCWIAWGAARSFLLWENAFAFDAALPTLRIALLAACALAAWRVRQFIKHDKI